jgi:hypothetical protein
MIRYHVPSVRAELKLERTSPHCSRPKGRIHSAITQRPISDPKIDNIIQRRMMCPFCKTTWTMRGFKSWDKTMAHPYLSQYLRGENGVPDLRRVI